METITTLKTIVEKCQRNEEYLRQLARQTREERKRVEQVIRANRPKSKHRVRFQLDDSTIKTSRRSIDDELDELARRCEKLLRRLDDRRQQQTKLIDDQPNRARIDVRNEILRLQLEQYDMLHRP